MGSWHERTTCRLCDAPLPEERVLDLGFSPLANLLRTHPDVGPCDEYPLYLVQCTTCGHVQLPVVVDPKLLFPADYPYASATGASMREHLGELARTLAAQDVDRQLGSFGHQSRTLAVDIGSNDGTLLGALHAQGLRTIGVDPATELASAATRACSLTIPEFFTRNIAQAISNACGRAHIITALNVFAHADDLNEIVEGVKVLLASEGRFVFEVGYLPDVLRTNNFGTVYHEHLSYHTLGPLVPFFERHGLMVYDYQRVDTQGGSIRVFVCREGERRFGRRALDEEEQLRPLLERWQLAVNAAATRFREHLIWRKSQGKTIAAYGCSAKSTTLLHVAGIGRETIDWIADDAPSKQGKFSPGRHIPIVPGSWLEEKQPDYCVSLSGNFSAEFKAGHPGYRGEWIEAVLT